MSTISYLAIKHSWHILYVAVTTTEHTMLSVTCEICKIINVTAVYMTNDY